MKLGLLLPTWSASVGGATPSTRDVLALARAAEAAGFDAVWLADHFWFEPYLDYRVVGVEFPEELAGVKFGAWECWTLASALAVATEQVEIGTLVSNTGYRNPALLARVADTVDDLSGGRVILGLGAGDFETEHRAFGYAFERRVGRFEEALAIVLPLLRGETVTFEGAFHRADCAALEPKSARAGGPPIMIGTLAGRPRMSRLVAQHADMWNCNLAFGDSGTHAFHAAWAPIERACETHGRDPATLERHATVGVNVGDGEFPSPGAVPLAGPPTAIAEDLAAYAALGVAHVSVILEPATPAGIEAFGAVIERLRGGAGLRS